ncbi:MAG: methyltransferase domain-containing protein, partial [Methylobacteriaceae bacterium]|nr:methyltransferase domain-containing protein [Methylobacteriaceae bacterium]
RSAQRARLARAWREGPADFLLAQVVADLLDRLAVVKRDFRSILDLGTPGPGLAQALTGASGRPFLVRMAGAQAALGGAGPRLVGDEEAQPFPPGAFDLIVSALALQGVNDLPGALMQARRALRPDGLMIAALVGGRSLAELREAFAAAESEVVGGVSPRVAPMIDLRDLGALLQRAGFALPVVDVDALTVRYPHALALMRDLRAMGATNSLALRVRAPLRRAVLRRAVEIYGERFADADGRVRATFEIIWLSGWAPHDSQQKPLAPGSAKMRLADALAAQATTGGQEAG